MLIRKKVEEKKVEKQKNNLTLFSFGEGASDVLSSKTFRGGRRPVGAIHLVQT